MKWDCRSCTVRMCLFLIKGTLLSIRKKLILLKSVPHSFVNVYTKFEQNNYFDKVPFMRNGHKYIQVCQSHNRGLQKLHCNLINGSRIIIQFLLSEPRPDNIIPYSFYCFVFRPFFLFHDVILRLCRE